ncbi:MAG: hypothetical protein N3F04_01505 [Candidatus Nezhaarchaeota archaeon]|nr:hypothetical protein [Candidatus Nezhaarchaeota archaeon]MCX8141454.1 hypothetical protein [Candidatus Nezhaarchaeota archaeon]MDW8049720.1 hypothetical protein [Nitrososphaerota archaeon]
MKDKDNCEGLIFVLNTWLYGMHKAEVFKTKPILSRVILRNAQDFFIRMVEKLGVWKFKRGVTPIEALNEHIEVLERLGFTPKSNFIVEQLSENNIIVKVMNCPYNMACEEIMKEGHELACPRAVVFGSSIKDFSGKYISYRVDPLKESEKGRHCIINMNVI